MAIRRLVDLHNPSLLVLYETMIEGDSAVKLFSSSFPGWNFIGMDAFGRLDRLLTNWRKESLKIVTSWAMPTILGPLLTTFLPLHHYLYAIL